MPGVARNMPNTAQNTIRNTTRGLVNQKLAQVEAGGGGGELHARERGREHANVVILSRPARLLALADA